MVIYGHMEILLIFNRISPPPIFFREATYQSQGVRWVYQGHHNQGIVNKMSDDLEPEGVTISLDQRFAYVSLPVSK